MTVVEFEGQAGWATIPGTTKLVIVHYKDGHTERKSVPEFLVTTPREKKKITKLECYDEDEIE